MVYLTTRKATEATRREAARTPKNAQKILYACHLLRSDWRVSKAVWKERRPEQFIHSEQQISCGTVHAGHRI